MVDRMNSPKSSSDHHTWKKQKHTEARVCVHRYTHYTYIIYISYIGWAWWHRTLTPVLRRQRQTQSVSLKQGRGATQWNTVSKKKGGWFWFVCKLPAWLLNMTFIDDKVVEHEFCRWSWVTMSAGWTHLQITSLCLNYGHFTNPSTK